MRRLLSLGVALALLTASPGRADPDAAALEAGIQAIPRASAMYVTGAGVSEPFGFASGEEGGLPDGLRFVVSEI